MISAIQLARRVRWFHPLARRIRTQAQSYDYVQREELDDPLVRSAGLATPRQVFLSWYLEKEKRLTVHRTAREIPRRIRDRPAECEEGSVCRVRLSA